MLGKVPKVRVIGNGKIVWKHRPCLAEFQMLTWNFGGGPSDYASTFFKMANAYGNFLYDNDLHAVITIIGC